MPKRGGGLLRGLLRAHARREVREHVARGAGVDPQVRVRARELPRPEVDLATRCANMRKISDENYKIS